MNLLRKFWPEQQWLEQIPANLRPDESKCEELEKLRRRYHLPNDIFVEILLGSTSITRRAQENAYANAKEKMPNTSEKDLLEVVFRSRVFPQNPFGLKMTDDEIKMAIQSINSLEDLIEYFTEIEKKEPKFTRDAFGLGRRIAKKIDEILKS